jgi:hypothetical protein
VLGSLGFVWLTGGGPELEPDPEPEPELEPELRLLSFFEITMPTETPTAMNPITAAITPKSLQQK